MKIRLSTVVVGVLGLISGIAIGYSRVRVSSSEREMKNKMYKYCSFRVQHNFIIVTSKKQ